MAYIRKLPSGKFRAEVEILGVRDSATSLSKVEVENWAKAREAEIKAASGNPHHAGKEVSVRDLLKSYLETVASRTDSARWNAYRLERWIGSTDPLMDKRLPEVVTDDLTQWMIRRGKEQYRGKPISGSTVNRDFNLLSGAFTYAVEQKSWMKESPCRRAHRPAHAPPRNRALLTSAEIKAIAIATGYESDASLSTKMARVGAAFFLAMETACRSGELLRVKPEHYWRAKRTLYIAAIEQGGRKGSKSGRLSSARHVPLTMRAIELLDRLLATMPEDQPYIIGMSDKSRDALWRKARDRSGVEDLTFHDLKHEACTRLSKHIDVIALSHAVGTKDIKLLRDTYYNQDAERAAALLPKQLGLAID